MQWLKCLSLLFLTLSHSAWGYRPFEDNECIRGPFKTKIIHGGRPFGLIDIELAIEKKRCEIKIERVQTRFSQRSWLVDVCRTPIHLKKGGDFSTIIRKETEKCPDQISPEGEANAFCREMNDIFKTFQNDGLIYADGEKEDLSSDHGKVYCTYQLLQKYLSEGVVFDPHKVYSGTIVPERAEVMKKEEIEASPIEENPARPSSTLPDKGPIMREL